MTKATSAALIGTLLLALGACSNDSPAADAPPPTEATTAAPTASTDAPDATEAPVDSVAPNGETVQVQALDNSFRPETLEISAGTEVVFTNVGRNDHNIIPVEDDSWGVATEDFAPKDVYSHVFGTPGTYAYYCSIHGTGNVGMIGTIVVSG